MKIAVLEGLGISAQAMEALEAPFVAAGHTFAHYDRTADAEALKRELAGAEAAILANMPLPAAAVESAETLRFIDVAFTGVDHVPMQVTAQRGITVSNASGYSNEAVPELTVAMALGLARNIAQSEAACRALGTKAGLVGFELKGKTVGIVGLGNIGRRSAELFHAFGCRILATSRHTHPDCPDYVTETTLEQVLTESDFVVLHCPLTPETRGMIDRERLALMKPSAMLINMARGPVVAAQDLADALNEGRIAGAGIDVFDKEPPLNAGEPLLHAAHTLLTPHTAFATRESMQLRAEIVFANLRAWMDGHPQNVK